MQTTSMSQRENVERTAVVGLVLAAKRTDAGAEQPSRGATACQAVSALEREIDERVYRLYGLTREEVKLVEESAQR